MSSFHNRKSIESDGFGEGSLSGLDESGSSSCDEALRLARIVEYQKESLRHHDPLTANLGALTSGLLEIAFRYEQAIKELLKDETGAIHEKPELQHAMSTYLNATRQVDRNVNLATRLADAGPNTEKTAMSRRTGKGT